MYFERTTGLFLVNIPLFCQSESEKRHNQILDHLVRTMFIQQAFTGHIFDKQPLELVNHNNIAKTAYT